MKCSTPRRSLTISSRVSTAYRREVIEAVSNRKYMISRPDFLPQPRGRLKETIVHFWPRLPLRHGRIGMNRGKDLIGECLMQVWGGYERRVKLGEHHETQAQGAV